MSFSSIIRNPLNPQIFQLIISCLFCIFTGLTYGQKPQGTIARINNVGWIFIDDRVIISYDIYNARPGELFDIQVRICDKGGKVIEAKSLSGDIGKVTPGKGKKIYWDCRKDFSSFNEHIYAEVIAHPISQPVTGISKGKAVALSTAFPGLGSAKITGNKFHYIAGAVGYGALATASYLYIQGNNTYDKYLESADPEERKNYYDDARSKLNSSKILFIAGACAWLADYVMILVSPNESRKNTGTGKKISFYPAIDPLRGESTLVLGITF